MLLPKTDLGQQDDKKFCYVENLGHAIIDSVRLKIGAQPYDINTCENLDAHAKTFLRKEQYDIHREMIGDIPELT